MSLAPTVDPGGPVRLETPVARYDQVGAETPVDLEIDPRWLSVQRLVNTESFAKASRLSSFLLYIVERFLQGRTDEITEQQIGVHVFGRPTHYNPGDDNIVRQTARQLRQRLALYYQEEGRNEHIHVVVPRGGYVPQFQFTSGPTALPELVADASSETVLIEESPTVRETKDDGGPISIGRAHKNVKSQVLIGLGVGLGLILGVTLTLLTNAARVKLLTPQKESDHLWSLLFTPHQRTIVVPGDAGVNMYSNLAKTQVGVSDYGSGTYLREPNAQTPAGFTWDPFASRRYTTLSDLKFISTILQLPNVDRSRMELRFARDLSFQDLQDSNAILIGSPNYDPWIQVFDKNQNFRMVYDGVENSISVLNRTPLKGEQASYKWSPTDPQRTGYAIIALTDNLESTGKVLLVQGTAMGGVDAATDFLFHSSQIDQIIRDAIGKRGKPANFELLLQTTMYFGGSMKAKVVAERVHPPA